jgi:hypothetical protein
MAGSIRHSSQGQQCIVGNFAVGLDIHGKGIGTHVEKSSRSTNRSIIQRAVFRNLSQVSKPITTDPSP